MQLSLWIEKIKRQPWLAEILAFLAGLGYFLQAWSYSHTRDSILDEGAYLLKGYLFASGEYRPFQANGVLTNHMPFSFLIPGYFQYLFGPGLQTGRVYAVFISLLFFLGAWILVRRLGGRWWAALAACTMAMNPMMIKTYSLAVSQGLVACLLVWSLVFALQDRGAGPVLLGSLIAGVLLMTRENMAPVFAFLVIYIFWRYGLRLGILAVGAGLVPILWGHLLYYPEIMALWVKWFSPELTPFFTQWRFEGMNQIPEMGVTPIVRLRALFQGFSLHTLPWLAILASWVLWSSQMERIKKGTAIFFSTLFAFLFAFHAWATLGGSHCVFCFSWYQYFFEILAILVVVVTVRTWRLSLPSWRKGIAWSIILIVLLALTLGIVFGVNRAVPSGLNAGITSLQKMPVPRFVNGRIEPGHIELWGLIANKFGLLSRYSYDQAYQMVRSWIQVMAVFVASGIFLFLTWWAAGWLRGRWMKVKGGLLKVDRSVLALLMVLFASWVLTPTGVLGSNRDSYDCSFNIVQTYESAGRKLAEQIPPGSKVFWWGSDTQAALLYLQDVEFFPALFNAGFANRTGDPVVLEKYGLWNDELIEQWASEADVILIEERNYGGWLAEYVNFGEFNELEPTGEMGCRGGTRLHVYMRLP